MLKPRNWFKALVHVLQRRFCLGFALGRNISNPSYWIDSEEPTMTMAWFRGGGHTAMQQDFGSSMGTTHWSSCMIGSPETWQWGALQVSLDRWVVKTLIREMKDCWGQWHCFKPKRWETRWYQMVMNSNTDLSKWSCASYLTSPSFTLFVFKIDQ